MKLRTIKILKYLSYLTAGSAQITTALLVYLRGDTLKQGFQSFHPFSPTTRIGLVWAISALAAFYAPVLARHFQALQDRFRLNDQAFMKLYRESIANAINDLEGVKEGLKDRDEVELGLLRTMVNIVRYYLGATDETKINANLMAPCPPGDPLCKEVRFLESPDGLKRCRWLLRVEKWARFEQDMPPQFCVPVYDPDSDWKNRILFGAPIAFVSREPYLVGNTARLRKHWSSGVSPSVKVEATAYFGQEKKVLRSFASLPATIDPDTFPEAIVNVQWNKKKIFGRSPGLVQDLLIPFLLVMAHVKAVKP